MNLESAFLVAYIMRSLWAPSAFPAQTQESMETLRRATGVGELTVILEDAALVGSVPRGATRVQFLTLNLSASCDADVTVDAVEVTHRGLGLASDIDGVYLFSDFRRLSRSVHFNISDIKAQLRMRGFVIPKCESRKVIVYADFSADASVAGEHSMTVMSPHDISTTAKTVTIDSSPDTVRVTTAARTEGAITVNFLSINGRLRYGQLVTAARLQLSADNKADQLIRSMTLTNQGTARNYDLIRLFLETSDRTQLTLVAAHMDRERVRLVFDPPFLLRSGQTRTLLLKAESHGSSYKTVNFTLQEDGDLVAVPQHGR